jgi:hypothetical protein
MVDEDSDGNIYGDHFLRICLRLAIQRVELAAFYLPEVQVDLAKEFAFNRPPKWSG